MQPIINLKHFNKCVKYHHFKMVTLTLVRPNCLLASVDLKDAYFTIPIALVHQKFLRFLWRNKIIVVIYLLVFGLSSAPRIFTKVMKPVIATLRNIGHISANYIDDSILIWDTVNECINNVQTRCALMTELGFVINQTKSHPTQSLEFLGFVIHTLEMTVRLPTNKMPVVVNACRHLANRANLSILLVAQVIGRLVSCFPAVPLGLLFYRNLERAKETLWKFSRQKMSLPEEAVFELQWLIQNVTCSLYRPIVPRVGEIQVYTDASLNGWRADCPAVNPQTKREFV